MPAITVIETIYSTASTVNTRERIKPMSLDRPIITTAATEPTIGPTMRSTEEFRLPELLPLPGIEVIRKKAPKNLEDIAKELGITPKMINLEEDKLTPIGENLFARRIGKEVVEFYKVIK